jgi:replicative DNA helicase
VNGWELAVIGTVLSDPTTMEVAQELQPQDFTGGLSAVWRHILALHQRGALEKRALIESLRAAGELDFLGDADLQGEVFIDKILESKGGQIEEYVTQVADLATRRQLREAAAIIAADAVGKSEHSIDEILDEAERRVMALRRTRSVTGVTIKQIITAFMPRLDGMRSGAIVPYWTPRCQAVKDIIDYVDQNDFVLIAGRPGTGKSSYLRYEAFFRSKERMTGLIFNLENTESEYAKSFISIETGIDSQKLRNPKQLSVAELERVKEAARGLLSCPLEIVTLGAPSIAEIERIARARIRSLDPKYIMIDYIQLITNGLENKVTDVSLTSQTIRGMAMKNRLNMPIICAAQLSREIERRGSRSDPQLADLRESGALEQDATIVIFPREDWHNPSPPEIAQFPENVGPQGHVLPKIRAVPIRFHVLKNRNGPIGLSERVKWCKATGTYQTLVQGAN